MTNPLFKRVRPHAWPVLCLLFAIGVIYIQTLGHDFQYTWDDTHYVYLNTSVHGFSLANIRTVFSTYYVGNYAPVQMLSYMLDYELWGLKAGGYLFTNLLLHALNGILVYRLILALHANRFAATLGALLFVVHPVQVESVAWISQRKNLLAMFFFLLAWEAYRRYLREGPGRGNLSYITSVCFFLFALLAKSVTIIFPVVILVYDFCFSVNDRRIRVLDKMPYVLVAAGAAVLALYSQLPDVAGLYGVGGGRVSGYHGGSPLATFYTMLPVFCRYLGLLVWPAGLSPLYAVPIRQSMDAVVVSSGVLIAGILFLSRFVFRRERRIGFWAIYFWLALLPVSQIIPLITLMNDRYLYFPMLGVAVMFGSAAVIIQEKIGKKLAFITPVVISLILVVLSAVSFIRTSAWKNPLTLWSAVVEKYPDLPLPWELLGEACLSMPGKKREALDAFTKAATINPASGDALYKIGKVSTETGDYERGYVALKKMLTLYPEHVMGLAALGDVSVYRGQYAEAEKSYKRALLLQPDALGLLKSLGNLAMVKGEFVEARGYFSKFDSIGGADPEVAFRLACIASLLGRKIESIDWLEKALQRGYRDYAKLNLDQSLSPIWDDPRFNYLMIQYFPDEAER